MFSDPAKSVMGAGDLEDPVVGAGAEMEFVHRVFEVLLAARVELAVAFHLARAHGGFGEGAGALEALMLDAAGMADAFADSGRVFRVEIVAAEFHEIDKWDFDMEVDAVRQWVGNPLAVVFDLAHRTAALAFGVAVEAARARIPFSVTIT